MWEFELELQEDPKSKNIDKVYYNAAIAYNKAKYYDSASRLFEKLVNDPRFQKSSFAADSLLNLAENYRLFFYFSKAIDAYLAHFKRYPNSSVRAYVYEKVAYLQMNTGDLRDAAATFVDYATVFQGRKEAPKFYFQAGLIYERLKNVPEQRRIWKGVIERYRSTMGQDGLVLQAMLRLARIAKKQRKMKTALKLWKEILREFTRRQQPPNSPAAAAAAEAMWELLDREFTFFARLKVKGSVKRQRAVLAKKNSLAGQLTMKYANIIPFKIADWSICAFYRQGEILRQFAQTIYDAPEPKGASEQMRDEIATLKEDFVARLEDQALKKFAFAVLKARELNVTGKCATRALEAANKFDSERFPLFRKDFRRYVSKTVYSVDPSVRDLKKKKKK